MPGKPHKVIPSIELFIKNNYSLLGCLELSKQLQLDSKTIYRYAKKYNLPGPARRFTAKYITKNCLTCKQDFQVSEKCITNEHPAKYCSKKCSTIGRRNSNSKLNECLQLAIQGLTNKEIHLKTNYPMGSVASWLNKAKYRRDIKGISTTTIRNKFRLNKSCEVCGFNRIVEVAHIIPASKQGPMVEANLLALCPNHHHLFDTNQLYLDEYKKIEENVEVAKFLFKGGTYASK